MIIKAEHTLNRVILAGAGGGLALVAAMFYPLYVNWPGRFVEGWMPGNQGISLALSALAVLIIPVTGYVAARWARVGRRASSTLAGALAGWIAALAAYTVLVAPAAGVGASSALLEWGYRPALGDAHSLWLTAEPVINTVYWAYAALWIMQIGGLALGALGGAFVPASAETAAAPELRHAVVTVAGLVALIYAVSLVIASSTFTLLMGVLTGQQNSSTGVPMAESISPYVFTLSPDGVGLIPAGSALLLFAIALTALYLARASQRRAGDPGELTGGVTLSFAYVLLPAAAGMVIALGVSFPAYAGLQIVSVVVCLGFAGLYLAQAIADLRRRKPDERLFAEWNPLIEFMFTIIFGIPIVGVLIAGMSWLLTWTNVFVVLLGLLVVVGVAAYRLRGVGLIGWLTGRVRNPEIRPPSQVERFWQNTLNVMGAGYPVALLVMSQIVAPVMSIVLLVIPGIVVIFAYDENPLSPGAARMMGTGVAKMVSDLYLISAQTLGIVLLVTFVAIGLILLCQRGWKALLVYLTDRTKQSAGQPQAQ